MTGVRRVRADEWEALRDLRLRALADAPRAFSTTHLEASARTEQEWRDAAVRGATGDRWVTFVATDAEGLVGMATGRLAEEQERVRAEGSVADLIQMWVDPRWRRRGIARRLAGAVIEWAAARGAKAVRLSVVLGEDGAVALYTSLGFRDTGRRERVRHDRDDVEMEMERPCRI